MSDQPPESRESPGSPPQVGTVGPETVERFGRPLRHFPVAVSADAMALAWANREDGPHRATVTVDHEVGARGFRGSVWRAPPADSLVCAVVLRPGLASEEGDVSWLVGGLVALEGAEALSSRSLGAWWPATVVEGPERTEVAAVKADVQLGPGRVKSVVLTMRFCLSGLGLSAEQRDELLESVLRAVDRSAERLDEGPAAVAAAYESRCAVLGQRVKVKLRPKGETRGTARGIDRAARLELASASGMIERVGIDQLLDLTVV